MPFAGPEFHKKYFQMAVKMVENILNICHISAIYESI